MRLEALACSSPTTPAHSYHSISSSASCVQLSTATLRPHEVYIIGSIRFIIELSRFIIELSHFIIEASHLTIESSHFIIESSHFITGLSHFIYESSHFITVITSPLFSYVNKNQQTLSSVSFINFQPVPPFGSRLPQSTR
jgi:hypothetical protein